MEDKRREVTPLTVFKASAGSGKTFTLAVEYIKLLVDNPRAYESILAVTFTNKATEEMKSRILGQLYGIANRLPDSQSYADKVCAELNLPEKIVVERAGIALRNLLHNYNFFRVQTIDTFFQGVMRNLAKELSLSNNLKISLNDKQVIGQAVDVLMDSLTNDKDAMRWIEEYVNDSMDEERSWNITEEIKSFGMNLIKELYKRNRKLLEPVFANPGFFDAYKKELNAMRASLEKKYKERGEKFVSILRANDVTIDDLSYGATGVGGYFLRLCDGVFYDQGKTVMLSKRVVDAMENRKGWVGAKSPMRDVIMRLADEKLIPLFRETEKERIADSRMYKSAALTLHNMNKLRLLHRIEEEILRLNGDHCRFMLSDTQTLLHDMIADDKGIAPFIFEKIGSRVEHIMIDEFQDTSRIQWKNFKVLLDECMSKPVYGSDDERIVTNNLIVGDVKQSIYRFRSGDWRLLNNIGTEFRSDQSSIVGLQTNFRSERNVIDFNNRFFQIFADIESERITQTDKELSPALAEAKRLWCEQLKKAYEDVAQLVPEKKEKKGLVQVRLYPKKSETCTEDMLAFMIEHIRDLMANGAKMSNIAILVRKNKDIPAIAEYIGTAAPEVKVISEEAFRLDSSPAVRVLVSAMRMIASPTDLEAKASLAKFYVNYVQNKGRETLSDNDILTVREHLDEIIPEPIINEESRKRMLELPLDELAEKLVRLLSVDTIEGQTIYISTFFDKLIKYIVDNGAVIEDFLKYWDEELCSKTVSVGNIDGIRIMSMHKSKGLEFDHVIVPYCNWNLMPPFEETLWCKVDDDVFSKLPFIPLGYREEKSLQDSVYEYYGSEESMQEIVDNLNLLYVAFTRAGRSLCVAGTLETKESPSYRATAIAQTLRKMDLEGAEFVDADGENPLEYTYGSLTIGHEDTKESDNVFMQKPENIDVEAHSYENSAVQFRQSNKSRDFANDVTDEDDSRRFIHNGTVLHHIFSNIRTSADIDTALREMEFEGVLYNEDTTPDALRQQLMNKLSNPQVADWFSERWQVFNECSILRMGPDGRVVEERPDRVITDGDRTIVIDYKFGVPHSDHKDQVGSYMDLLRKMGHKNVEGYLWYVQRNRVVSVECRE